MPEYLTPGVYVEEVSGGARPIEMVGTRTAAFLGVAPEAGQFVNTAVAWPARHCISSPTGIGPGVFNRLGGWWQPHR